MRETWHSRLGFILATAGFAIGLGNVWRFPYLVGANGGGAFLLVYLAFCFLIGIPLLTQEIALGRKAQLTPIAGMVALTGKRTSPWNLIGVFGVLAGVLIMSYYLMLIGWIVAYFFMLASGRFTGASPAEVQTAFDTFTARPLPVLGWTLVVCVLAGVAVSRGLQKGLERIAKVAMPLLFVLLVVLAVRSLTFPGARAGLVWYLKPDFSALDGSVVLAALGQSFYSIGIGMAAAFGFGSYLHPSRSDVPGNAAIVVAMDTLVALVAGLVIFPALFAFGLEPDSGPGLLFLTMTNLFARMPAGQLFGGVFFFLLIIAGLTSAIAQIEVLAATAMDLLGARRRRVLWPIVALLFVLSVPVILSQGPWAHLRLFDRDIFGLVDTLSGNYVLTLGALLLALYTAGVWKFDRFRDDANRGSGWIRVNVTWRPFVQVLIPVAVIVVLLAGLGLIG